MTAKNYYDTTVLRGKAAPISSFSTLLPPIPPIPPLVATNAFSIRNPFESSLSGLRGVLISTITTVNPSVPKSPPPRSPQLLRPQPQTNKTKVTTPRKNTPVAACLHEPTLRVLVEAVVEDRLFLSTQGVPHLGLVHALSERLERLRTLAVYLSKSDKCIENGTWKAHTATPRGGPER